MNAFNLVVVALCGVVVSSEAVGHYLPVPYAAGYVLPYAPPYAAAYPVVPAAGAYYSGADHQDRKYQQQSYEQPQDTKYYYGGKFQGACSNDGLYYKDDTTFVICSNGYASEQPCPPGTKTGGYPSYQAGYYYGYTDLCSVNLVDYGYGPSNYATAAGYSTDSKDSLQTGYKDKSYGAYDDKTSYNTKESSYSTARSAAPYSAAAGDSYSATKPSYSAAPAPYASKNSYPASRDDGSGYSGGLIKEIYPSSLNVYPSPPKSSYTPTGTYNSQPANPYLSKETGYPSRDSAYPSGNAYPSKSTYQSKGSSYPSKDTVYSPRDDYSKDKRY